MIVGKIVKMGKENKIVNHEIVTLVKKDYTKIHKTHLYMHIENSIRQRKP